MLALWRLGGVVCLGLCVISIPLLSLSPKHEPGEKQQPGHSQSRQITGVPACNAKTQSESIVQTTNTNTHKHTQAHTCTARVVAFLHASKREKKIAVSHFSSFNWRMKRNWLGWTLTIELKFGICETGSRIVSFLAFFMCFSKLLYAAHNLYGQQILTKPAVYNFMARCFDITLCGIIYCLFGLKTRPTLIQCHNCLSPHLWNGMGTHRLKRQAQCLQKNGGKNPSKLLLWELLHT